MKLSDLTGGAAPEPAPPPGRLRLSQLMSQQPQPNVASWKDLLAPGRDAAQPVGPRLPESPLPSWKDILGAGPKGPVTLPKTQAERQQQLGEALPIALSTGPGPIGPRGIPPAAPSPEAAARAKLLQDFQATGVPPRLPTVGQGRFSQLATKTTRALPFSPVQQNLRSDVAATESAAERAAGAYGGAATPETAGAVVRDSVNRFASDRTQARTDYDEFFRLMHGAPPAQMTNTLQVVRDLMGRFPNAPGLTGMFTRSPIAKLASELEPRTETIPAQTSPILGPGGQPIVTRPAQSVRRGGVLSVPEIKELRTQVGYQLDHPSFGPDDLPRAQVKRLYAALTQDLGNAARTRSPAAYSALVKATTNYAGRMRLLDQIESLVSPASPEGTFGRINLAAGQSGSANVGLLESAKKVMGQDWGNVGSAMIRRLGFKPGRDEFVPAIFATNWAKLSDRAKDIIFGADQPGSPRAALESVARVARAQGNVSHLLGQSPTGEINSLITAQGIARTLGTAAGGYPLAKLMMSPRFAKWWFRLPKMLNTGTTPQRAAMMLFRGEASMVKPETPRPGTRGPQGGTVTDAQTVPSGP